MIDRIVAAAHRRRWMHGVVIVLRYLLGFAFLPAGLKKMLGEPFTDPANTGRFHEFLHAFHATGGFYRFVGVVQLCAAVLLMTQRFALAGALVLLPVITAITAFCWSTAVYPTAVVATLMWLGAVALVVWDLDRWRGVVRAERTVGRPWVVAGVAILAVYFAATVLNGGVYRPRGAAFDEPAFYLLIVVPLIPLVTWIIQRARR
jgi:uncharacterized membrane protein YphA (DoxX/SURF4 family)